MKKFVFRTLWFLGFTSTVIAIAILLALITR